MNQEEIKQMVGRLNLIGGEPDMGRAHHDAALMIESLSNQLSECRRERDEHKAFRVEAVEHANLTANEAISYQIKIKKLSNELAALKAERGEAIAEMILTHEDIEAVWIEHGLDECDCHGFARAIEQAILNKIGEPASYAVLETDTQFVTWDFICGWPEAAHEHINEQIDEWKSSGETPPHYSVVKLYRLPEGVKP